MAVEWMRTSTDRCLLSGRRQRDFSHDALPERREDDAVPTCDIEEPRADAPVDWLGHRGVVDAPGPFVAPLAVPHPRCPATAIKQDQTPAHGPRQLHARLACARSLRHHGPMDFWISLTVIR